MDYTLFILILASCGALFMAFSNGANDVANSFASAVGSKALTLKRALLISSIVTFLGAVLLGGNVAACLVEGIAHPALFNDTNRYILAMLTVLLASGTFILLSTITGMPVSSTHSIVGSLTGVSIAAAGWNTINWNILSKICISWIASPLLAGIASYSLIVLIQKYIIGGKDSNTISKVLTRLPYFLAVSVSAATWVLTQGSHLAIIQANNSLSTACIAIIPAPIVFIASRWLLKRWLKKAKNTPKGVERAFRRLQIGTSCAVAFSNGANDVANSISPVFAIYVVTKHGGVLNKFTGETIPFWILTLGGIGIVLGIMTFGQKVISTLGKKITKISNSRGFCIDYSVASVVLCASALGIPVSTTHAATGAIVGAGLSTGARNVHFGLLGKIFIAWIITVPSAALITVLIYQCLNWLIF